jgi:hypothetical protein
MRFQDLMQEQKFTLVVSLPSNDLELAKAALEGGADAVKVHCNVWHRASGHTFGTYEENKDFLKDLIALCGDVPVGLVPGTSEAFITEAELGELEEMGLDFISAYSRNLPMFAMDSKVITNAVAIGSDYTELTLDAVRDSDIEILECSVVPGEAYGTDLSCADVLGYAGIVKRTGKPCMIPTQKKIRPEDVKYLHRAGCKALMIGAIVLGQDPTPEKLREITAAYRTAVDAL